MTPNEATIVGGLSGALLGAVASILTTRYMVKHGPNYEAQISAVNTTLDSRIGTVSSSVNSRIAELNASLERLTQAHTKHFAEQASFQQAEVERQNASQWRPNASIQTENDSRSLANTLVLKSVDTFTLVSVSMQTKAGATLAAIPIDKTQKTTGYRVTIPHQSILKVKQSENLGGLQNGAKGQIMYVVEKSNRNYEFTLPFTTEDVMVSNTIFIKLLG